jgi:hypothetical protein
VQANSEKEGIRNPQYEIKQPEKYNGSGKKQLNNLFFTPEPIKKIL